MNAGDLLIAAGQYIDCPKCGAVAIREREALCRICCENVASAKGGACHVCVNCERRVADRLVAAGIKFCAGCAWPCYSDLRTRATPRRGTINTKVACVICKGDIWLCKTCRRDPYCWPPSDQWACGACYAWKQ